MTNLATADSLTALAAELTGPLLQPGSTGYAAEIAAFNSAITHTPDIVVGAASTTDVQAAVRFAAAHGLASGCRRLDTAPLLRSTGDC